MSIYITGVTAGQVHASTIGTTVTVRIGDATTLSFDSVPAARQWVDALDRAIGRLEVQQRGEAA